MSRKQIKLYFKNVLEQVIGTEHGITPKQFNKLAQETTPLIKKINAERQKGNTPYRDLPYNKNAAKNVKQLVEKFRPGCKTLIVLGIGGSALGNIALQSALNPYMYNLDTNQSKGPRLFVLDNVDPDQIASFLDWLDHQLESTVINVISKSGRTAETASQLLIIRKILIDKLGKDALKIHLIATTDPEKGTLRKIADDAGLACLEVPQGVGGRFSVLSPVGLFSAAMCGIDIDLLLEGARDMDERTKKEDFYKNPAAINAAVNHHYYNRGKKISVMMPYSFQLKDFADWYRQLWAESLGKAQDLDGNTVNVGPTPVKALGTTDQHSQVQLYRQGPNDKLFTFLQVHNFQKDPKIPAPPQAAPELQYLTDSPLGKLLNSEKYATEYALACDNRPSMTVHFDNVTPYTVGQFIYLFEVTTSIAAALLNINAYDQPAVELGKDATFALMNRPGYEKMQSKILPFKQIHTEFLV